MSKIFNKYLKICSKVTDTLACLGTIPASMQEKLSTLRTAMGNDGVYFSVQGRYNLFTNLAKTIYCSVEEVSCCGN